MINDLLGIGKSGVLAQQRLLHTTSNNTVNINSEGYVRQRTLVYTNNISLGTGDMVTQRVIDRYAQAEMWRDSSSYYASSMRHEQLSLVDGLLGDGSNNVSQAFTSYFNGLNTANQSPADKGSRNIALTQITNTIERFKTLSESIERRTDVINNKIADEVNQINSFLVSINEFNNSIMRTKGTPEENLMLFDQRDEFIKKLAEKIDVRTINHENGSVQINMASGNSLLVDGGISQFKVISGEPDPKQVQLQLQLGNNITRVNSEIVGGSVGGLFLAQSDIEPVKRDLGQLAVAFGDAMNRQNRLGMDLDNELGGDLFTLPTSNAMSYATNSGNIVANISFISGRGGDITASDYEIQFSSATNYDVYILDNKGERTALASGSMPPAAFDIVGHGINVSLTGTAVAGDKLKLQPTKNAAAGLGQKITRPEDIALAFPLKADRASTNFGSGSIKLTGIFNTAAGSGFGANILSPLAPQKIKIDPNGNYAVYAANGTTLIGIAPAASKGVNLMASIISPFPGGPLVYSDPKQNPGYEFSIIGNVSANDEFTISYNSNGFSDNGNGLIMAKMQSEGEVRRSFNAVVADTGMTFDQAYSTLVIGVGTNTSQANTQLQANNAKLTQSKEIYESVSGVNLEEEAANLIRFQQAYSASAQIVNTAKSIFDTLLSAVR